MFYREIPHQVLNLYAYKTTQVLKIPALILLKTGKSNKI